MKILDPVNDTYNECSISRHDTLRIKIRWRIILFIETNEIKKIAFTYQPRAE